MQESNLCKKIPDGSHNCWGYGIYGGKVTMFQDYKEGIYTVTKGLATRYKPKGLVTPEQIMTMYTPSSNGSWAFSVNHFMENRVIHGIIQPLDKPIVIVLYYAVDPLVCAQNTYERIFLWI